MALSETQRQVWREQACPVAVVVEEIEGLRRDWTSAFAAYRFCVRDSFAEEVLRQHPAVDVVLIACAGSGLEVASQVRAAERKAPIILIVRHSSEERAVAALRMGISDYLRQPFSVEELLRSIERCRRSQQAKGCSPGADAGLVGLERMVGGSQAMREINLFIQRVAASDSHVLITGETGTGKELAAELLHLNSPRRNEPWVCLNCAAVPDTLLESELFGYEKGAFTGAVSRKAGRLEQAGRGTIFFDEIGDMSPDAQAKILRAIETHEVERLGSLRSVPVRARTIAATNHEIERLVEENRFRKDLYFRLNVARVHLPPLRDRKEDIPALLDYHIRLLNVQFGAAVEALADEAMEELLRYDWPGNVRELRNVLESTFLNLPPRRIGLEHLPEPFRRCLAQRGAAPLSERERMIAALTATRWNVSRAAEKMNCSRMTLYRKMAKHHIGCGAEGARDGPSRAGVTSLPDGEQTVTPRASTILSTR